MKNKTKKKQSLTFAQLDISDIEQNEDYLFGVEMIPSECWTLHFYDQYGNHKVREVNKILN